MATLSGDIAKSLLVLLPEQYDLGSISTIRHKLYAKGFIVVREENRSLNSEAAAKIAGDDNKESAAGLIGNAYLLVVARDDATNQLATFIAENELSSVAFAASKPATATSGIRFLFPRMMVDPIPSNVEARDYVHTELKGLLVAGLTEVAKEKPANAVEYLARYLLENNPNKPPVV